ncbi:gamma-tubulin complex component 4 [Plakobranchus ocellatus]|uniref:Gamma-tubulin complex component 4 n=1 Tax=Plakobranchus ocellatus TaxID=259542 RepID=A0AAV3YRK6_9GAST|nr:gamma-tubulin complex component 4 [Plakobranchus ocellatus]
MSLNDCLEIGPKLIPDLVQILLRLRRWKYGLSAGIQKSFLQIELESADRDVHRFLLMGTNKQPQNMGNIARSFADHGETLQKILGLTWCTGEDCFKFETAPQVSEMYTKRSLLRLIARQFDPLGLLTRFTVSLKILFQNVSRMGYEWDEVLP